MQQQRILDLFRARPTSKYTLSNTYSAYTQALHYNTELWGGKWCSKVTSLKAFNPLMSTILPTRGLPVETKRVVDYRVLRVH